MYGQHLSNVPVYIGPYRFAYVVCRPNICMHACVHCINLMFCLKYQWPWCPAYWPRCPLIIFKSCPNLRPAIIYTTKMDEFVCAPNISETIAVRIMKLAHRPRIASTMIKLISKPLLLSILSILFKKIQRIGADPKRKSSPPFVCLR